MNEGWVKLYRKSKDNPLMRDSIAWMIFSWILLTVNRDDGKMTLGRKWASEYFDIPASTFWGALKRLEKKYKVIDLTTGKTTIKYTIVSVQRWHFYQSTDRHEDNQPTINRQSTDTYTRIENKELRKDLPEKISNRLILTKGQLISFAKEYPGLTTTEINEQRIKCNDFMNKSSENYKNPGTYFNGWLKKYDKEKRIKESQQNEARRILDNLPMVSDEERERNLERLAEMRKSLRLGVSH